MVPPTKEVDWVKPGFIVAGSAKCGTTSVFHYASQHPEICLPRKESFYFMSDVHETANKDDPLYRKRVVSSREEYQSIFSTCAAEKVTGEIATGYLYYQQHAIPGIKRLLGDPKIIIILRNPVERAWSGYLHLLKTRATSEAFETLWHKEEHFKKNHYDFMWYLVDLGLYYQQVKAYLDNFSDVKILMFDELKNDTPSFMKGFFEFVGVDSTFAPDTSISHNVSGVPSNKFHSKILYQKNVKGVLRRFAKSIFSENSFRQARLFLRDKSLQERPDMPGALYDRLLSVYRNDIELLQALVNQDLTHWLDDSRSSPGASRS